MARVKKGTAADLSESSDQALETLVDRLESMVSERPLVAMGMAAGAGLLLGFLWRR
jgi:ElaB/YqjD/DUF883 family membrane-anchored ribosome-binding protein